MSVYGCTNPGGLTFSELRRFVQQAMRLDVTDDSKLKAQVKLNGQLAGITVVVPDGEAAADVRQDQ